MTLTTPFEDFRLEMEAYRQTADDEAKSLKDSQRVLFKLRALYERLDGTERVMADQVLGEWAMSQDEAVRFDALYLISEFRIYAAIPALQTLANRLRSDTSPGAPYELKKVVGILTDLKN